MRRPLLTIALLIAIVPAVAQQRKPSYKDSIVIAPLYIEYNVGNYARSFQFSSKIDQDRITAELKDGVMTVTLPKAEKAKPRRINVS